MHQCKLMIKQERQYLTKAVISSRIFATFISCIQGCAEVWSCPGRIFHCTPFCRIVVLTNARKTGTAKLPAQTFATCKRITKTSHQVRIKKRKKLYGSCTT